MKWNEIVKLCVCSVVGSCMLDPVQLQVRPQVARACRLLLTCQNWVHSEILHILPLHPFFGLPSLIWNGFNPKKAGEAIPKISMHVAYTSTGHFCGRACSSATLWSTIATLVSKHTHVCRLILARWCIQNMDAHKIRLPRPRSNVIRCKNRSFKITR